MSQTLRFGPKELRVWERQTQRQTQSKAVCYKGVAQGIVDDKRKPLNHACGRESRKTSL